MGNVVIKGRARSLDFNQFSAKGSIEKLFGPKMYGLIQAGLRKGEQNKKN